VSDGSRREVTAAGLAAAVSVAVIGALIGAIPALDTWWKIAAVLAFVVVVLGISVTVVFKEARRLVARRGAGEELTAYTYKEETGVLLKGKIPNVSLRVETIHMTIDKLVEAVPEERKADVLHQAGYAVGKSWAHEFGESLWHYGLRKGEIAQQLLRWSEYDATAGMGRLIVALEPDLKQGTVMLLNSFLSKTSASFPLNHWFAGYIAGTMEALFGHRYEVELDDLSAEPASLVGFRVRAAAGLSPGADVGPKWPWKVVC
jgi:predicted hydrocarbon binding protein